MKLKLQLNKRVDIIIAIFCLYMVWLVGIEVFEVLCGDSKYIHYWIGGASVLKIIYFLGMVYITVLQICVIPLLLFKKRWGWFLANFIIVEKLLSPLIVLVYMRSGENESILDVLSIYSFRFWVFYALYVILLRLFNNLDVLNEFSIVKKNRVLVYIVSPVIVLFILGISILSLGLAMSTR